MRRLTSSPLLTLAGAELRRQTRRPVVFAGAALIALLLYQPLAYTGPGAKGLVEFGAVAHDSPILVATLMGRVGLVALLFAALIFGDSGHSDRESGWRAIQLATPTDATTLVLGRYLGCLAAALVMFVPGLISAHLALGGLDPSFLGPAGRLSGLLAAMVLVVVPMMAMGGAVFLGLALFGGMAPVLVAYVAVVVLHPVIAGLAGVSATPAILTVLDPVGTAPLIHASRYWSAFEREVSALPVGYVFALSRTIWLVTGGVALALAIRGLRATADPSADPLSRLRPHLERWRTYSEHAGAFVAGVTGWLPKRQSPRVRSPFVALLSLNLRRGIFHPATAAFAAMAAIQVYRNLGTASAQDGSGSLAVTAMLIGAATNIDEFVLGLTILLSGFLVWRDERDGSSQLVEGTPIAGTVVVGTWILGLFAAQAAVVFVAIVLTTGFQLSRGFAPEPGAFAAVFGLVELPRYFHWAVLALLVQLLAPSRSLGFAGVAAALVAVEAVLPASGFSSPLLLYGAVPAHPFSAMNGLHPFTESILAFRLYWLALTVPIFLLAARLWRRGPSSLPKRWVSGGRTPASGWRRAGWLAAAGAATFAVLIGWRDASSGQTTLVPTEFRAEYERRFGGLESAPVPELVALDLDLDFHPDQRAVLIEGLYTLVNRSGESIDRIDVFLFPILHTRLVRLRVDRLHRAGPTDTAIGHHPLELREPLSPEDTLRLAFTVVADAPRIFAGNGNPDLAGNGTYIDNFLPGRYFPVVGYRPEVELTDAAVRTDRGLPERSLPHPHDPAASRHTIFPPVARFSATVSVPEGLVAVGPGDLLAESAGGGRRSYSFAADSMRASVAFVVGRYDRIVRETDGLRLEIYHHPDHAENVEQIFEGIAASLAFNERFARYPHRVLRVVEVPDYGHVGGTARSHPTLITWNETGGWLDDYRSPGAFPYALATAAHEAAHQWWPGLVAPAVAEGFGLIGEGLADYARVRVIDDLLGPDALGRWMREQSHGYFTARGHVEERPLLVSEQPFVYRNKSQFALRWLAWAAGPGRVDEAVRSLTSARLYDDADPPTSATLKNGLLRELPDSLSAPVHDWFDRIMTWDVQVRSARSRPVEGVFETEVELTAARRFTGPSGAPIDLPTTGAVEVGLYDAAENKISVTRHELPSGRTSVTIRTTVRPARVIVDPHELLLDANQANDEAPIAPVAG